VPGHGPGYATAMKIRRRKSRAQQVAGAVGSYLKVKAVAKAAKGATKAAKGTAAYQVAKRTPAVRRLPIVAGAGVAAFAAAKLIHRGGDEGAATA
jgi:hypothetical protein